MATIRVDRGTHRTPAVKPKRKLLARDNRKMFASFYEKYLPPSVHLWRQITYLRTVIDTLPTTQLLRSAKRTIGLVHLATQSQDPRLVRESRIAYARLLGQLQFQLALTAKTASVNDMRELTASIALMTHLSDPAPVSSEPEDDGWAKHLWGAQQVLATFGPSRLGHADRLNGGLLRHVFANCFHLAVAKRKAWDVDATQLREIPSYGWTSITMAFCKLPGLLQSTDTALSQRQDASTLLKIISGLGDVRSRGAALFPEAGNLDTIDVRGADSLKTDVEEHVVMQGSAAFPRLFAFSDREDPSAHRFVIPTHLQLIIECTILRIWHFRSDTLTAFSTATRAVVELSAYKLARRLCMSALFFTAGGKLVNAIWFRLYLMLARNVFEAQGRVAELGWCEACLVANKMRMERLRPTSAPTLCKIEDVMAGIAEAGRFKSMFDAQAFVIRGTPACSMRLLQ
ncbi:hypothetical protein LTR53_012746 [Teratosphaeriaceae sp. CCFEE 6253]|nr:hypothetical protein LTR53_012746 [Teratosphaeriaceae sp. CCFEE 6253]